MSGSAAPRPRAAATGAGGWDPFNGTMGGGGGPRRAATRARTSTSPSRSPSRTPAGRSVPLRLPTNKVVNVKLPDKVEDNQPDPPQGPGHAVAGGRRGWRCPRHPSSSSATSSSAATAPICASTSLSRSDEAVQGGKVRVPTLDGSAELTPLPHISIAPGPAPQGQGAPRRGRPLCQPQDRPARGRRPRPREPDALLARPEALQGPRLMPWSAIKGPVIAAVVISVALLVGGFMLWAFPAPSTPSPPPRWSAAHPRPPLRHAARGRPRLGMALLLTLVVPPIIPVLIWFGLWRFNANIWWALLITVIGIWLWSIGWLLYVSPAIIGRDPSSSASARPPWRRRHCAPGDDLRRRSRRRSHVRRRSRSPATPSAIAPFTVAATQ